MSAENARSTASAHAPVAAPGRGLTWVQAWSVLPPLILVGLKLRALVSPQDFWWHLRIGEIILRTGEIPQVDLFSFTRTGETWINQAWGMQALFYAVYARAGIDGILFLHTALIAGGYILLGCVLARRLGWVAAWGGVLAAFFVGIHDQGVRPQSVSFLLFGALVAAMELHRVGTRAPLRLAPLLFLVWVNAHGGFVFGLGALVLHAAGRCWSAAQRERTPESVGEIRELVAIVAACGLALAFNPQGPLGIVQYVLGFFQSDVTIVSNAEFSPLSPRSIDGVLFALSLGALALALRAGTRLTVDQAVSLLVFGIACAWVRRILPWYGFLLAPVLAQSLWQHGPWIRSSARQLRPALYVALAVLYLISSAPMFRSFASVSGDYLRRSPVEAIARLCDQAGEGDRVFVAQEFASLQVFRCPKTRVFIDTRMELYPLSIWSDYFALLNARFDWQELARDYELEWLLVPIPEPDDPPGRTLLDAASESPLWTELYRDDTAALFHRADITPTDS